MITRVTNNALLAARTKVAVGKVQRRHRRRPWLVDQANSQSSQSVPRAVTVGRELLPQRVATRITRSTSAMQRFKTDMVDPFFKDLRTEHLKEISLDEDVLTEEQKLTNQRFLFASVGVVSVGTCTLLYPPLVLLHIPIFIWMSVPLFKEAYEDLVEKRRVTTVVVDATLSVGSLAFTPFNPSIFLYGTIGHWVYAFTNKIIAQAKDGTRKQLTNLMGEQPKTVWLLRDSVEVDLKTCQSPCI